MKLTVPLQSTMWWWGLCVRVYVYLHVHVCYSSVSTQSGIPNLESQNYIDKFALLPDSFQLYSSWYVNLVRSSRHRSAPKILRTGSHFVSNRSYFQSLQPEEQMFYWGYGRQLDRCRSGCLMKVAAEVHNCFCFSLFIAFTVVELLRSLLLLEVPEIPQKCFILAQNWAECFAEDMEGSWVGVTLVIFLLNSSRRRPLKCWKCSQIPKMGCWDEDAENHV